MFLTELENNTVEKCIETFFSSKDDTILVKEWQYKCNCSKKYIGNALISVGKGELLNIIKEDGNIKVHCHYCNKDYVFTQNDVEELFSE